MPSLYPSWIEIPVTDLDRALAFYRAVFELTETPIYEEPASRIAVLLPSEKERRSPGVSLVQSRLRIPGYGVQVNFHVGGHAALAASLEAAALSGAHEIQGPFEEGDGVLYATLRDCEGNPIALSSFE